MPSAIFHLTNTDNAPNRYAIEQGATFDWLTLVLAGNFTNYIPRGQIRDRYVDQGGIIKASFSFLPLVMGNAPLPGGETISGTLLQPRLLQAETTVLDWFATKMNKRASSKEPAIVGKNVWVYDIELQSPSNEIIRVVEGYIEVVPEVTR